MRPSIALSQHAAQTREVLARFGLSNARVFGSTARSQDTESSDLDLLVEAAPGTSLYDLAQAEIELEAILRCKVEILTKGFLTADIAARAETDSIPMP